MNIAFPGNTRGIPEVGIIAFPDVDRIACLGIAPYVRSLSSDRHYRPRESSRSRDGSLNRDYHRCIYSHERPARSRENSPRRDGAIVPYIREGNMPYRREGGSLCKGRGYAL